MTEQKQLMTLEAVKGNTEVVEIQSRGEAIAANAAAIVVKDGASATEATGFLVNVKTALKTAESTRKDMTAGIVAAKKNIDGFFRELTNPYKDAEKTVKEKLGNYHLEQERIRQDEERRLRVERELREAERTQAETQAAEWGEEPPPVEEPAEEPTEVPEPVKTVRSGGGSASMREVWKYEIVDSKAIPRHFWMVDEGKIQRAVDFGDREIPGLRIYKDIQVVVRT